MPFAIHSSLSHDFTSHPASVGICKICGSTEGDMDGRGRISRRGFMATTGAATVGLLTGCETGAAARPAKKPNVVFVLADQWRAQACGYAGDPNLQGKTPTLDRLAAESVNFTHAVSCCPVCTPYRASRITGQYPGRRTPVIVSQDAPLLPELEDITLQGFSSTVKAQYSPDRRILYLTNPRGTIFILR